MLETSFAAIAAAVDGTLLRGGGDRTVAGVETDSRRCGPGMLFVPLAAVRDGHDFIDSALDAGAAGTLCARVPTALREDKVYLQVADTRQALLRLAAWYRDRFSIPFIQITGSVGKTTTKEMIAAVLSERYHTLWTEGNFNNDIGVPRTLFRLTPEHEMAVIETGMNHFGEIRTLGAMVRPDAAVISNVGDAHIENLGSREGILRAKCEIFEHLKPEGFAVLNGDDVLLNTVHPPCPVYRCGESASCDVRVEDVQDRGLGGVRCTVRTKKGVYPLDIPAPGRHMIYSAAMAAVLGEHFGLTGREIAAGVAHYEPAGERMRLYRGREGALILSDCYNANPQSMAAAIHTLAQSGRARTAAVLGDMGELGPISEQAHYETGVCCAREGVGTVVAIGERAREIARGAKEGGCADVCWFAAREEALGTLDRLAAADTAILIKASHAMGFQTITAHLTA